MKINLYLKSLVVFCLLALAYGQVVASEFMPGTPIITTANNTTFCSGASATLEVDVSNSPACAGVYEWSSGATGLSIVVTNSGNYSVQCNESGSLSAASNVIQITVNPIPAAPTVSGGGNYCTPTTSTTLLASGCNGTVTWSDNQTGPSITVSNSGTYTATCTENGCTSGNSSTLTVNFYTTPSAPSIQALGPTTFCEGGSVMIQEQQSPNSCTGILNWSNNTQGPGTTISTSGTYFASCDFNGCVSPNSSGIQITVHPIPTAPTVSGGGDFCTPTTSSTLSASDCNGTVTWSDNQTGPSITVSNSGTYTATCTENGCTSGNSSTLTVNFYTTPSAPSIQALGPTTFCEGGSVMLQEQQSPNSCTGILNWSNNTQGPGTTISTSGTYFASCDFNGCVSPNSSGIQITVHLIPSAPTVSGGGDFCTPTTSTTLSASGCNGTVTWSDNQTGPSITVSNSGTYTATCTENDCTSGNSSTLTVNFYTTPSAPSILALGPTTFCEGGSVMLQEQQSPNSCTGILNWSNNTQGPGTTISTSGTYFASCDFNGCVSPNSSGIQVTVHPIPTAPTVSGGGDFCTPTTSSTLSASGCNGTVTWSDNQTGPSITVSNSGTYTATCTENGCTSGNSSTLTVNFYTTPSAPSIQALGPTTFCEGGSVMLQEQQSPNSCTGILNWSNNTQGPGTTISTSGTYFASCDFNGCVSPNSSGIQVTVHPFPTAPTVSGGGDFCTPTTSSTLSASGCNGTVTWSDNQTGPSITVSNSGTYTATCTENGCSSGNSNGTTVNFYTTPSAPIIEASGPTSFCSGSSVTLQIASNSPACNGTLRWSTNETGSSINVNSSGNYTLQCEENGCSSAASNSIQITVNPIPVAPTVSGGGDFCTPTISSTLSASGCNGTVTWSDNQTGPSITVSNSGTYTATCTENGCTSGNSSGATVNFYITPSAPIIVAGGPTSFCSGSSVTLQIASNSPACNGTLRWSTNETGSSINVNSSGNYSVQCEENGCSSAASNSIAVTSSPSPAAPTVSGGGNFCTPTTSSTLSASGCNGTVTWSDNQTGPSITVSNSGTYTAACTENGCTSGNSSGATVNFYTTPSAPIIEAGGPTSLCSGSSVTLQIASNSPACNGTLRWSTNETGSSINVNSSGNYSVQCEENGCSSAASNSIQITVNPIPAAPTVSGGGNFCTPTTSSTLSASGCNGTVTWSDNQTGPSITVSNSGTYTTTCTENGCTSGNSSGATVNFYITPSAPIIEAGGPTSFCSGSSVTLQIASNSPACNGTLRWSTNETGSSINVNSSGNYSVQCEENGCASAASNSIAVTSSPSPAAPTVSGGGNFCTPTTSSTLSASGCNGTVTWSDNQTGPSITVSNSGTYTTTCTENGCTSGNSNGATVNFYITPSAPIIVAGGPTSFCSGSSVTLQIASNSPACNGTLRWSTNETGSSISATTSGNYSVLCEENGCASAASNSIAVTSSPNPAAPTVSGGGNFCTPTTSTTLSASGCNGTVTWSDNQTGPSITVSNSGTYTATCTEIGCTSGNSSGATVNFYTTPSAPIIEAGGPTSFCSGSSVTLQIASNSPACNGTLRWSDSQTGSSISATTSGNYSVQCEENGCTSAASNSIAVTSSPSPAAPTVSGGGNFCTPTTSSTLSASGCNGTVTWSDNQTGPSITVSNSGTYTATCTENGCTSGNSSGATVNFYTTPSAPIIEAGGPTSFCSGSSVTLQIASNSPACNGTLRWSTNETGSSINVNSSGNYSVQCEENGCSSAASNSIQITVNPIPAAPTVSGGGNFCTPTTSSTLSASGCNGTVTWSDNQTGPSITVSNSGTYTATCTENGCTSGNSSGATVNFYTTPSAPIIEAGGPTSFCSGSSVTLQIASNSPACNGTLRWSTNETGSSINVNSSGNYSVQCEENGCTSAASNVISVTLLSPIQVIVTKKNVTCFGFTDGEISLSISGGLSGSYQIQWAGTSFTGANRTGLSKGIYSYQISQNNACATNGTVEITEPQAADASITSNPITCFGANDGKISLLANGGTPNYKYQANGGALFDFVGSNTTEITNLNPDFYNVSIFDANGCLVKNFSSIQIVEPQPIQIEITNSEKPRGAKSQDGKIEALIKGGTLPYKGIAWNLSEGEIQITSDLQTLPILSTANQLKGGFYTLQVLDANSCFQSISQDLPAPLPLSAVLEIKDVLCSGESNAEVLVIANGGVKFPDGTYNYTLVEKATAQLIGQNVNRFTNLKKGANTIIVKDFNGIEFYIDFEIEEPEKLGVELVRKIDNYCENSPKGLLELKAKGGTPDYTFNWSNGKEGSKVTDLNFGSYSVKLIDKNNCELDTFFVMEPSQNFLRANLIDIATTCPESCDGKFVAVIQNGIAPFAIDWPDFPALGNQTEINDLCGNTSSTFRVTDSLGCVSISNLSTIKTPEPEIVTLADEIEVCPTSFQLDAYQFWAEKTEWTLPSGEQLNTQIIEGKGLGLYKVKLYNAKGCLSEKNIQVKSNFDGELYLASPSIAPKNEAVVFIDLSQPKPSEVFWNPPAGAVILEENSDRIILEFAESGTYKLDALATVNGCAYPFEKEIVIVNPEDFDEGGFPASFGRIRALMTVYPNPIENYEMNLKVEFSTARTFELRLFDLSGKKEIFQKPYQATRYDDLNIRLGTNLTAGKYLLVLSSDNDYIAKTIIIR